jgi:hypothetical protein
VATGANSVFFLSDTSAEQFDQKELLPAVPSLRRFDGLVLDAEAHMEWPVWRSALITRCTTASFDSVDPSATPSARASRDGSSRLMPAGASTSTTSSERSWPSNRSLASGVPDSDIEKNAVVAVRWLERAMLAEVPLEALLFAFFALEALLGDRSESLKAHGLAYRRAMLSVAVQDSFAHPNRIYGLYDQVRSDAVHGNDLPALDDKEVRVFVWDVRVALGEYLRLAADFVCASVASS